MATRGNYLEQPLQFSNIQLSFDPIAIDNFVESKGVIFKHWKAIPCTGGDNDRGSMRSTHINHTCSNGFYFKGGNCFVGIFDNDITKKFYNAEGIIDSSISTLHVPRFYKNNECQLLFGVNDRLDLEDETVVVPKWEKMECSPTGLDRAMFPVVRVEYIIDMNGKEYQENSDFLIENGNIRWLSQNRPQFNQDIGGGGIYAIRYLYRPSWYVSVVLHEIRLANTFSPDTGEKTQVRYPQLLIIQREIFYLNELNNAERDASREGIAPGSGMNLSIK